MDLKLFKQNGFHRKGRYQPHKRLNCSQANPFMKLIFKTTVNFVASIFVSVLSSFIILTPMLEKILNYYKITSKSKCWRQDRQLCEKLENNDVLLKKNCFCGLFSFSFL